MTDNPEMQDDVKKQALEDVTSEQRKKIVAQIMAQIKKSRENLAIYHLKLEEAKKSDNLVDIDHWSKAANLTSQELDRLEKQIASYDLDRSLIEPSYNYDSPMFCSIKISGAILRKWRLLDNVRNSITNGQTVKDYLGSPVTKQFSTNKGITVQYFERGMLSNKVGSKDVYVVYGPIYLCYRRLGGLESYGWPVSDEIDLGYARRQEFNKGTIYWSKETGAHEVHGSIRDWILEYLDEGYPITDIYPILNDNGAEIGQSCRFKEGAIYCSPSTGCHIVQNNIREDYENKYGGPLGALGFPTSDEMDTPRHTGLYCNFQNGVLVWHPDGSPYAGVSSFIGPMDLYLDRF